MNRRHVMQMAGIGALAATAHPPPARPPGYAVDGCRRPLRRHRGYRFEDEFDGPAGSAPDLLQMGAGVRARGHGGPDIWELPGNVGQYRDDRRNLFLDGKSNLVIHAAKDGNTYYSGKLFGKYRGGINTTWEARIKLNCLTPGCWPAWYLANNSPVNGGEVDLIEWYGNGSWARERPSTRS